MFTFQPLPQTDARDRIAGLPLVTREMMDNMLPELRAYAFTLTGLDVGDQMARVRDEIAAVPMGAKTWAQAKKTIAADLKEKLGGKESQRRAELLLRTHVFRGYAAARYRALMAQIDAFPYWQYKTHGDGNVRPSHAALNGKIFPAGHDIWQQIFPPWDWGCRCLVVPLTAGAVSRIQDAGMPSNKDASLLPTQIAKPEVFTAREADLINQSKKLPGGISLNHAPTWSAAPWSIPGNIRHDWPLIEARYGDQPEVLAAFKEWAAKTEIEKGVSVSMWIGDGVASKKSAKSTLRQGMRKKSRYGLDVEFDDGEEEALRALLTAKGAQKFGALPATPAAVEDSAVKFEAEVVSDDHENAAAWSPDGTLRERRRSRFKRKVSLFDDSLLGGHTSHNHPDGGPPSLEDIDVVMNPASRPVELRIVTHDWLYRVAPGPRATADFRKLPGYDRAWNAAAIVGDQLRSSMDWTEDRTDQAVQHGLISWLANQGVIHYERLPR